MPLIFRIIEVVIFILIGILLVALVSSISSPKLVLNKDEWICKNEKSILRMQQAGKVMVPITDKHCTEYIKKEY